ncbi:MAG: acyl-CoA thioesterase [Acidobacteria bacterium]|nr:acyl-CoA thioesterase [Acidobacteriota bacterium]
MSEVPTNSPHAEGAPRKFTTKIHVYWHDCDAARIAYYGNFLKWLEMAEEDLFLSRGRTRSDVYLGLNIGFPRVEVWIRYRKPARLSDTLEVTLEVEKRTRTSLVLRVEMRRQGETDLVAEATSRLVCINREFQPVAIPDEMLKLLDGYLPSVTTHTHDEVAPHPDAPRKKERNSW